MIIHRTATEDDRSYILDTFRNYCKRQYQCQLVGWAVMARYMNTCVNRWTVTIACDDSEPTEIVGYLVSRPSLVEFMYVREGLRNRGIGRGLIDSVMHKPKSVNSVFPPPSVAYAPNSITVNVSPWFSHAGQS